MVKCYVSQVLKRSRVRVSQKTFGLRWPMHSGSLCVRLDSRDSGSKNRNYSVLHGLNRVQYIQKVHWNPLDSSDSSRTDRIPTRIGGGVSCTQMSCLPIQGNLRATVRTRPTVLLAPTHRVYCFVHFILYLWGCLAVSFQCQSLFLTSCKHFIAHLLLSKLAAGKK